MKTRPTVLTAAPLSSVAQHGGVCLREEYRIAQSVAEATHAIDVYYSGPLPDGTHLSWPWKAQGDTWEGRAAFDTTITSWLDEHADTDQDVLLLTTLADAPEPHEQQIRICPTGRWVVDEYAVEAMKEGVRRRVDLAAWTGHATSAQRWALYALADAAPPRRVQAAFDRGLGPNGDAFAGRLATALGGTLDGAGLFDRRFVTAIEAIIAAGAEIFDWWVLNRDGTPAVADQEDVAAVAALAAEHGLGVVEVDATVVERDGPVRAIALTCGGLDDASAQALGALCDDMHSATCPQVGGEYRLPVLPI